MRSERGQGSVEWVGVVLLVAIALGALARFAPRADGRGVGATVLQSVIRPATRMERPRPALEGFTAPPLVPLPREARPRAGLPARPRSGLPRAPALLRRARRGFGVAWRRAWFGCLVYERTRYALLHPESRFPGYTIPGDELLRIANDCISPVDVVRDWRLVRGR